jgi:hypothetical protein
MENRASRGETNGAQRRPRSARARSGHVDDDGVGSWSESEQTPLLEQNGHGIDPEGGNGHDDSDQYDPDAIWKRERSEWLGLPWYKQPSVRHLP